VVKPGQLDPRPRSGAPTDDCQEAACCFCTRTDGRSISYQEHVKCSNGQTYDGNIVISSGAAPTPPVPSNNDGPGFLVSCYVVSRASGPYLARQVRNAARAAGWSCNRQSWWNG
jgi:hypothetical protein